MPLDYISHVFRVILKELALAIGQIFNIWKPIEKCTVNRGDFERFFESFLLVTSARFKQKKCL